MPWGKPSPVEVWSCSWPPGCAILPGWINTDMTRQARIDVDGLHDRIQGRTPADRWGDPEDLAGVAVFLSAAASNFVTGTAIPVDGGFSVNI